MYFTIGQLIPLDETVKWTVHNVPELLAYNAWTAVSIPMEVGFGATMLSKWTISLHANAETNITYSVYFCISIDLTPASNLLL
jgi:hypothetical protein